MIFEERSVASFVVLLTLILYVYMKIWTNTDQLGVSTGVDPIAVDVALGVYILAVVVKNIIEWEPVASLLLKKETYIFATLFAFSFIFYYYTKNSVLIWGALAGYSLRKEKASFVITRTGMLALGFFILHLCFFAFGIVKDDPTNEWGRQLSDGTVHERMALGFSYPTRVFAFLLPACLGVYYLSRSWLKRIVLIICAILAVGVYCLTDTKTTLIIIAVLALSPITEFLLRKSKTVRSLAVFSYPILTFVSLALALFAGII